MKNDVERITKSWLINYWLVSMAILFPWAFYFGKYYAASCYAWLLFGQYVMSYTGVIADIRPNKMHLTIRMFALASIWPLLAFRPVSIRVVLVKHAVKNLLDRLRIDGVHPTKIVVVQKNKHNKLVEFDYPRKRVIRAIELFQVRPVAVLVSKSGYDVLEFDWDMRTKPEFELATAVGRQSFANYVQLVNHVAMEEKERYIQFKTVADSRVKKARNGRAIMNRAESRNWAEKYDLVRKEAEESFEQALLEFQSGGSHLLARKVL